MTHLLPSATASQQPRSDPSHADRKVFPFSGPTNHPGLWASPNGTTVVDLDFGRVAFLTCFDANCARHAVFLSSLC